MEILFGLVIVIGATAGILVLSRLAERSKFSMSGLEYVNTEHQRPCRWFSKTSETVICRQSMSFKSALAKLLQGFYVPAGGQIKLDGTDIRYLAANELRQYFGVVPQETVLFSGTIYDNLLMANPQATFEQVAHACQMAEIHAVIEALPQGYQTEIGERGVGLSGGQKQRLAIARALLKQPKILVFDEATSSLDAATAEHFAQTINQLKGKVTMLFITHALPKALIVDQVVRIEAGGLRAVSTPSIGDHG